jgi:hypothetical protein
MRTKKAEQMRTMMATMSVSTIGAERNEDDKILAGLVGILRQPLPAQDLGEPARSRAGK